MKGESVEPSEELEETRSKEEAEEPEGVSGAERAGARGYVQCETCEKRVSRGSWARHVRAHRGERRYSCATCGLAFTDGGNLARHARALHARVRPHRCPQPHCRRAFSRRAHLLDHVRCHDDAREYVCDVCGKASKSPAALRMHKRTHEDVRRFRCVECGSEFKRSTELKAHVTVHTGEKAHACACGRSFRLRSQLTAHSRVHVGPSGRLERYVDVGTDPRPRCPRRICSYCPLTTPREQYNEHLVRLHGNRVFRCAQCHSYLDKADLLFHMTRHADRIRNEYVSIPSKRSVQDEDIEVKIKKEAVLVGVIKEEDDIKQESRPCRKRDHENKIKKEEDRIPKLEALKKHRKKVMKKVKIEKRRNLPAIKIEVKLENEEEDETEDLSEPPPKRPRRTKKNAARKAKQTVEVAVEQPALDPAPAPAPPSDRLCGQDTTSTEAAGDASEQTKDEEKALDKALKARTCPICGKLYRASSSYFYHMKYFHKRSREHECEVCGKKFGTKANLAQHASIHTGTYELECKECGKRFRSKPSLYIHEQSHGGVKRYACAQCGRSFRWRTHLARHVQRHAAARAHVCTQCGRGFSVRCDLLRHARTHAAAEYHCDACPLKFAQKRYLKVHMIKKHADTTAPAPTPAPVAAAAPAAPMVTRS